MERLSLIGKYTVFAIISTAVNLGAQAASFALYTGILNLYVAMFIGTGAGLVTKYILDKKYIFYYQVKSKKEDVWKFVLYTAMGIITTIIFWGTEAAFYYIYDFAGSQYIGAIIGLTIGYVIKYFLDKHFVFVKKK